VEHAAEVVERTLVRFQKRLLRRVQVGAVERRPLAIERIANTCTLVRSPPRSAQASYQSTCASWPQL
jgi:hypothetical protein